MLGSDKTRAVRAFVTASSPRSRDVGLYRRYAAALYRQALLARGDPVLAEYVVGDVSDDECALAPIPERVCRLASSSAAGADGSQVRTSAAGRP